MLAVMALKVVPPSRASATYPIQRFPRSLSRNWSVIAVRTRPGVMANVRTGVSAASSSAARFSVNRITAALLVA